MRNWSTAWLIPREIVRFGIWYSIEEQSVVDQPRWCRHVVQNYEAYNKTKGRSLLQYMTRYTIQVQSSPISTKYLSRFSRDWSWMALELTNQRTSKRPVLGLQWVGSIKYCGKLKTTSLDRAGFRPGPANIILWEQASKIFFIQNVYSWVELKWFMLPFEDLFGG
jgi:hypothetical protein